MGTIKTALLGVTSLLALGCHEPLKDLHITNKLKVPVAVTVNQRSSLSVDPGESLVNPQRIRIQPDNIVVVDFGADGSTDQVIEFAKNSRNKVYDGSTIRLVFE